MDSILGFMVWRPLLALMGWAISAAVIRSEVIEDTSNYLASYIDKYGVPSFILFLLMVLAHLVAPILIQFFDGVRSDWAFSLRSFSGQIESFPHLISPSNTASMRLQMVQKDILALFPAFFAATSISAARKVDLRIRTSLCVIHFLSHSTALLLAPFPFSRHLLYVLHHVALGALFGLFCFALLPQWAGWYMELGFQTLVQLHLGKQWLHQAWDRMAVWTLWSWTHDDL